MNIQNIAHAVSIELASTAELAFSYLSNPVNVGKWALGCWETEATEEEGMFSGTSLFDGEKQYFRADIDADRCLVDFYLGKPQSLKPRISIRVIPGSAISKEDSCCVVTLSAWRDAQMNDERWGRLCAVHEAEIHLLKALIEQQT